MKIHCKYDELADPRSLKDNPKNRNKHPSEQIERLAKLYEYHGIRHPIIVSALSGYIVAGHGRKQAAIKAGLQIVPVVYQEFESLDHEYAFVQADNAISLWAELDIAGIQMDALELPNDFNIEMLGIKDFELPSVTEEQGDPDEVPEPPKEPRSKLGDLYELGNHRLLCGDSTSIDAVERLMNGEKADMVFTDPPYGMNYSGRGKNTSNKILNDNIDPTEFYNVLPEIKERYIWGRVENYKHLLVEPRDTIIWKKNNFGMGKGYRGQYEVCFYYGSFNGSDSDVWEIKKDQNYVHPTQKPVELCERAIKNSNPQNIIDVFGGSGSTLIACEKTNRKCFMMELDPHYIDVIISRYVKFTGNNKIKLNGEPIEWSLDG